jgi:hypothetical protein
LPFIEFFGPPNFLDFAPEFAYELAERLAAIKELRIKPRQVTIFAHNGMFISAKKCKEGIIIDPWRRETIVLVSGMCERDERKEPVQRRVANLIVDVVRKHYQDLTLAECFIGSLTPECRFATWSKRRSRAAKPKRRRSIARRKK